jgi:hypothetical protein
MFWLVSFFLNKKRNRQASPSENIVCDNEDLYTATYHCHKKEKLVFCGKELC